jgi:hypothetical protein
MLDQFFLRNKTFAVNNWCATHTGFLRFSSGPCDVQRLPCASLDGMAINRMKDAPVQPDCSVRCNKFCPIVVGRHWRFASRGPVTTRIEHGSGA